MWKKKKPVTPSNRRDQILLLSSAVYYISWIYLKYMFYELLSKIYFWNIYIQFHICNEWISTLQATVSDNLYVDYANFFLVSVVLLYVEIYELPYLWMLSFLILPYKYFWMMCLMFFINKEINLGKELIRSQTDIISVTVSYFQHP